MSDPEMKKQVKIMDEWIYLMVCLCLFILFLGVVPKPSSQVASSGEAGGGLHQAAGHPVPLSALLQPLPLRHPGLRAAAGPLALHPDQHLRLPAVPARLPGQLPEPLRLLRSFSSSFHACIPAGLLLQLPGFGTRASSGPHRLCVPPTADVPVLS